MRRVKADLQKVKSSSGGRAKEVARQPVTAESSGAIVANVDAKCVAEVKRLRSENAILKDANKQLEERNMVRTRDRPD